MAVSRGYALVCSAALHTLGVGAAGWATNGLHRDSAAGPDVPASRVHDLRFLTLVQPTPRPKLTPLRRAAKPRHAPPPKPPSVTPPASLARPAIRAGALPPSPLQIRELTPGAVTSVTLPPIPPPSPERGPPPLARGVDRAAALVSPAGSACPELPRPDRGDGRPFVVAVAFVVDTSGRVERSGVRLVESPRHRERGRGYYPRIYVIGTKARAARRVQPAGYDSAVSEMMASHVGALRFQPALLNGRPVRSTVLVACHQQG